MKSKDIFLKKIGKKIADERKKKGITLEGLATDVNISKGNLSEIERGMRDLRISTIKSICKGLELPMRKLLEDV